MRTLPVQSPASNLSTQSRTVVFLALVLFALSGLISGFAVGVFVHPKGGSTSANSGTGNNQPVVQKTQTPVFTPTPHITKLGFPTFVQPPVGTEIADNMTTYTITIQAVDQAKDAGHGNPVHTSGITCKIWLTKDQKSLTYKDMQPENVQNPIGDEIPGSLIFSSTPQVQLSDANGQATWKYQVSSSVEPGNYYLTVLTDWEGKQWNWWWELVSIKKAG